SPSAQTIHSILLFMCSGAACVLHPSPTRRSSDLGTTRGRNRASPGRRGGRGSDSPRSDRRAPHERASRSARSPGAPARPCRWTRSEEHTSELQSRENLVCRLLLEKKNLLGLDVGP